MDNYSLLTPQCLRFLFYFKCCQKYLSYAEQCLSRLSKRAAKAPIAVYYEGWRSVSTRLRLPEHYAVSRSSDAEMLQLSCPQPHSGAHRSALPCAALPALQPDANAHPLCCIPMCRPLPPLLFLSLPFPSRVSLEERLQILSQEPRTLLSRLLSFRHSSLPPCHTWSVISSNSSDERKPHLAPASLKYSLRSCLSKQ